MNELANILREAAGERRAKKQPRCADLFNGAADEIDRLTTEVSALKADIEIWEGTVGQIDKTLQRTKAKGARMIAALQAVDQGAYSISERTVSLDIGVITKVKAALSVIDACGVSECADSLATALRDDPRFDLAAEWSMSFDDITLKAIPVSSSQKEPSDD